jgi:hypothetical protein
MAPTWAAQRQPVTLGFDGIVYHSGKNDDAPLRAPRIT